METTPEPVSLVRARGGMYVDITITEDSGTMAPRRTHEAHGTGTCFLRTGPGGDQDSGARWVVADPSRFGVSV